MKPFAWATGVPLYEDEGGSIFTCWPNPDSKNQRVYLLVDEDQHSPAGIEELCSGLHAALLKHIGATADTIPPPPAPAKLTGSTVYTKEVGPEYHPDANVFDTDDQGNLVLLDNDTDSGQVALYAAGTWHHAVSHGTYPYTER